MIFAMGEKSLKNGKGRLFCYPFVLSLSKDGCEPFDKLRGNGKTAKTCGRHALPETLIGSITSLSPSGPGTRRTCVGCPHTPSGNGFSLVR